MKVEGPRSGRYPFTAALVLTNLDKNRVNIGRTKDLSVLGCHIAPGTSVLTGTQVRIQITHKGEVFEALGRVTNARQDGSVGIAFTKIEQGHQFVLDQWIRDIRNAKADDLLPGD